MKILMGYLKKKTLKLEPLQNLRKVFVHFLRSKPLGVVLCNITTFCNLRCLYCKYTELSKSPSRLKDMTIDDFRFYGEKLKRYGVLSGFITGGEPTLNKFCSQILKEAVEIFPFNITLNTNLCNSGKLFTECIKVSLSNNISIETSLDGFQKINNILRPSVSKMNVYKIVLKNMQKISEQKRKMKSNSFLSVNIVVSNFNVRYLHHFIKFVCKTGWVPTIQLVQKNGDLAQKNQKIQAPSFFELYPTILTIKKLFNCNTYTNDYLNFLLEYVSGKSEKYCPYLHKPVVFKLWPNGDITICDSRPIGNLNFSDLDQIFNSEKYAKEIKKMVFCEGCSYPLYIAPYIFKKRIIKNIFDGSFMNIFM